MVVGAGPAARALHLPVLAQMQERGDVVLSCICDLDHERARAAHRQFGFLDNAGDAAAALARPDVRAVYLFGSAQLHHQLGLRALDAGKHLFVEKPIAPSFEEACQLAEAARTRGLVAVGGHNRRFYRALEDVRARAGRTGWRYAEATFHKPESGKPPPFGARTWLTANGIHALDALLWMMGDLPEQMTAFATAPDMFSAVMRWPDGAQASFRCNNQAGARREEYAFHAAGETCRITDEGLAVERNGSVSVSAYPMVSDGFAAEHEAFISAIRTGEEPRHSIARLAPSLFIAQLIENGFQGRIERPRASFASQHHERAELRAAVLVDKPADLLAPISRLLPDHELVSVEDVRKSEAPRLDVRVALLGRGASAIPSNVLDRLPRLEMVGVMGLSLMRFQPEDLLARGIAIVNASSAYADSVAEFALGLAILGRRRAFASHELMRRGGWGTAQPLPGLAGRVHKSARNLLPAMRATGLEPALRSVWQKFVRRPTMSVSSRDLKGTTVGLMGWGANAQAFARLLVPLGARVLVCSQHASASDIAAAGGAPASLSETLAADIVSLHRGLTPQTRHCLGRAELDRLRPGAVLINVARGSLIEPEALLARLRKGDVFACLDSFSIEPLPARHPLRRLPNVFLTSHIAGGSPEMHAAAATEVVEKIATYLAGDALVSITEDRLRTMT
jgi:phosphoglycerate dehydrogenase-like enzyme/predicted dehydrogenase